MKSPRNKMISDTEVDKKDIDRALETADEEPRDKRRKRRYFFPHIQRSVEATSREEALQLIKKELS